MLAWWKRLQSRFQLCCKQPSCVCKQQLWPRQSMQSIWICIAQGGHVTGESPAHSSGYGFQKVSAFFFMNWQPLVPIKPLVISRRGPGASELIDRQLGRAVPVKTSRTWIKIVGWCHVTVWVCPGRPVPGIVCIGVVSFYSLFKESSCRAAHDNSLQEGLWRLCAVSVF